MQAQEPSVTVRLFIFSGRPDPEWTLDDAARDQLLSRVRDAIGKEYSNPPPPPRLGYRGFLVRPGQPGVSEVPEFTVFSGVLTVDAGPRATYSRDIAGVEEFLLAQARERGYGDALDMFGAGSKGRPQSPAPLAR